MIDTKKTTSKIIGTLGHIDHGKTSLIRAMTGTDTDRLPDEKRRGMTIDLGFAWLDLPSQGTVGIVDVPGHEAYVRNMLAGATGIDLGLLVIAADDGVMPQTREHIEILGLLKVPAIVCAMTKIDVVDDDIKDLAGEEIVEYLAKTPYAGTPVIPVSSETKEGIEKLKDSLDSALNKTKRMRTGHAFRLPIDRSFSLQGIGCVVTGTIWSGKVKKGDEIELHPGGKKIKVRRVQTHGLTVEQAKAGQRTALNLSGIKSSEITRGEVIASPGSIKSWSYLNSELYLLPSVSKPLKSFTEVRVHLGTAETSANIVFPLAEKKLYPGQSTTCQVRLHTPITAARGDRFIIRQESPVLTLGGGTVLLPSEKKIRPKDKEKFAELKSLQGGKLGDTIRLLYKWKKYDLPDRSDLPSLLNVSLSEIDAEIDRLVSAEQLARVGKNIVIDKKLLLHLEDKILKGLKKLHDFFPSKPWIKSIELRNEIIGIKENIVQEVINDLIAAGKINKEKDGLFLPGHAQRLTTEEKRIRNAIFTEHKKNPFKPGTIKNLSAALALPAQEILNQYKILADEGEMIDIGDNLFFRPEAIKQAGEAAGRLTSKLGSFAVKDFRDELQTSRKHAVPLLEHLDKEKITIQRPDKSRVTRD